MTTTGSASTSNVTPGSDDVSGIPNREKLPEWGRQPFLNFDSYCLEAFGIAAMGMYAVVHVSPQTLFAQLQPMLNSSGMKQAANLIGLTDLVERWPDDGEVERLFSEGLPRFQQALVHGAGKHSSYVLAHLAVDLWGALEVLVRDFATAWLLNVPDALETLSIQRLTIEPSEFFRLEREGQIGIVIRAIEQQRGAPNAPGVGRFDPLLDALRLGPGIDDQNKKRLLELQQLRNVIVHRGGVADDRLAKLCPWLPIEVGKRVLVNHVQSLLHFQAAFVYSDRLYDRARAALDARS